VKFNVAFELTSHDLAVALADRADRRTGTTEEVERWLRGRRKREIRYLAQERLEAHGDPDQWPGRDELPFYDCARETIQKLWPEGA
jgi:hypothetical protein